MLEEIGGDPNQISFATQELESLCSHVSQNHPLPIEAWSQNKKSKSKSEPRVSLECPHPNQVISSIKFASFGTPQGKCGSFSHGECQSTKALSVLKKVSSYDFDFFRCIYMFFQTVSTYQCQTLNITGLHWVKELQCCRHDIQIW